MYVKLKQQIRQLAMIIVAIPNIPFHDICATATLVSPFISQKCVYKERLIPSRIKFLFSSSPQSSSLPTKNPKCTPLLSSLPSSPSPPSSLLTPSSAVTAISTSAGRTPTLALMVVLACLPSAPRPMTRTSHLTALSAAVLTGRSPLLATSPSALGTAALLASTMPLALLGSWMTTATASSTTIAVALLEPRPSRSLLQFLETPP